MLLTAFVLLSWCPSRFAAGQTLDSQFAVSRSKLVEDNALVGRVPYLAVLADGRFAVASNNSLVILFDSLGSELSPIGSHGGGPGEYRNVLKLDVRGDTVVAWDAAGFQYLAYSADGELLWQRGGFTESSFKFAYANGMIAQYLVGRRRAHYLLLYDVARGVYVRSFGLRTPAHDVMMNAGSSGGVAFWNDKFYFVGPAEPVVHWVDPSTFETGSFDVPDSRFKTSKFEGRDGKREDIVEYLSHRSIVGDLMPLEDYLVVQIEDGYTPSNSDEVGKDRALRLFFFDKHDRFVREVSVEGGLPFGVPARRLAAANGSCFYNLSTARGEDGDAVFFRNAICL